jgi:predicted Zn-dependent protease
VAGPRVWDGHYLDGRTPHRRPVRVVVGHAGLEVTRLDGDGSFRWPLAEVRQTQGFYAGEEVRLERGGDPAEALVIEDLAFLSALRAGALTAAARFHDPARRQLRPGLAGLAAVAAVALALGLYFWGIPALAAVAAARVPVAWEVALGDATMARLAPASRRCADPERQRQIDAIVATLLRPLPDPGYPFRVVVVDHAMVNAFAAPGGSIVVLRGLLERTDTAEELAAVLAHEIQHVRHRHTTRAILRDASTGILVAAVAGDVSAVATFGVQAARTLGDLRHSREAEREADRDGMRMLQQARVDPRGMLAFFESMQALEGQLPAGVQYLSTHPTAGDRLRTLSALAAQPPPQPPVRLLAGENWDAVKGMCRADKSRRDGVTRPAAGRRRAGDAR